MKSSHSEARRTLTVITRLTAILVRGRSRSITLDRNVNRTLTRTFVILIVRLRFICRRLSVIIFMTIRARSIRRLTRLAVSARVRRPLATRLLRRFTMISLTNLSRQDRSRSELTLVIFRCGISGLLLNVLSRLLTQLMKVNFTNADGGRTRMIMCLNSNTRDETKVLVNNLLLCKGREQRADSLIRVKTLRTARRITNVNQRNLCVTTLSLNGRNIRYREELATALSLVRVSRPAERDPV